MGKLSSAKEIEKYTCMSIEVCLKERVPMAKIAGRWQSHTDLVDNFIKDRVKQEMTIQNTSNA